MQWGVGEANHSQTHHTGCLSVYRKVCQQVALVLVSATTAAGFLAAASTRDLAAMAVKHGQNHNTTQGLVFVACGVSGIITTLTTSAHARSYMSELEGSLQSLCLVPQRPSCIRQVKLQVAS